ncbi:unnamed protein product, partial [Oppiella nova]
MQPVHEVDAGYQQKYGRIFGMYTFTQKVININDADLLRDIFVKDFHVWPHHLDFHLGTSKLDKSLFFMPGNDDWKRQRSILSPVFTSGKLRAMMAHISEISDRFIQSLSQHEVSGEAIDIRKHVGAFAMDVISRCAYGIDVESIKNPNHPLVLNARKILSVDANIGIIVSALFPALGRLIGAEPFDMSACRYFDDLTKKIIDERKLHNNHKTNTKRRTDFIQLMIDSEKSDKDFGYDSISDGEPDDKSAE